MSLLDTRPLREQDVNEEDLENLYSGGLCYELALWINQVNPGRYQLWEATSKLEWDGSELEEESSAHWFIKDLERGVFLDVYGDSGTTPESVLKEWPDFDGDNTVRYHKWEDVNAAKVRIKAHFPALSKNWEDNARYTCEELELLK